MSPGKSVNAAEADHLADLRRSLSAGDEAALRAACAALRVPAAQTERFTTQGALILERAQAQLPAASNTEVELALGVLLTLLVATPATARVCG